MSYQRSSIVQKYGDQNYLAHQIRGNTQTDPYNFVADRVSSYGIINFGYIKGGKTKRVKPLDLGIEQDILLRSLHNFTTNSTGKEVTIKLFLQNQEFLEQQITDSQMPYTFPPGAIVNPNLELEVRPKYDTMQLLVYWQPVHIISYDIVE